MKHLSQYLSFTPNSNQKRVLAIMHSFFNQDIKDTFILSGAAGTGKTSVTEAITNYFNDRSQAYSLCAPTGRAAKVISDKTKQKASTLHKQLYTLKEIIGDDGLTIKYEFIAKENMSNEPTVFIIDESSMISHKKPSDKELFVSENSLLYDLIKFVKNGHPRNKIVFIGDEYQLPPIDSDFSPALNPAYLEKEYSLNVYKTKLTEIVRQQSQSFILKSANEVKKAIDESIQYFSYSYSDTKDLSVFLSNYLQKHQDDPINTVLIAWKNTRIYDLNRIIRQMKFGNDADVLCPGDQLVVTQNYYTDVVLNNGSFLRVHEIISMEDYHGFKFADVSLFDVLSNKILPGILKISMDDFTTGSRPKDFQREKQLYAFRIKENRVLRETKDKRTDGYLSALKVNYGYAITAHKAQGGEWKDVFIYPEVPFKYDGGKWLYTVITRASENIYSFKN